MPALVSTRVVKVELLPAPVLGVEHHAQVQQLGLLPGEFPVGAQGVEDGLGGAVAGLVGVKEHALPIEVAALDLVGVGHDGGHAGDEGDALAHVVLQRLAVGVVVVGIEGQDGPGQLVHNCFWRGALMIMSSGKYSGSSRLS